MPSHSGASGSMKHGPVVIAMLLAASLALGGAQLMRANRKAYAADACSLRVLALGDSLTEGFHSGGLQFHSYALHLRELLKSALPSGCQVVVHERGRSGEFVLRTMQGRLMRALSEAAANLEPYDWVCLLGGTNDIGTGEAAADVLEGLAAMHSAASEAGAHLVAMTLPPFNTRLSPQRLQQYSELNEGLRQRWKDSTFVQQQPQQAKVLLDLEPLFPVSGIDGEVKRAMWDDHLHLTPAGYDKMAGYVFEQMQLHLTTMHRHRRPAITASNGED